MNFSEARICIIKLISFFDGTNRTDLLVCQGSMIQQAFPGNNYCFGTICLRHFRRIVREPARLLQEWQGPDAGTVRGCRGH